MKEIVKKIAQEFNIEFAALMAFIEVESGGRGFDSTTGRIIIQFEPSWFRRKAVKEYEKLQALLKKRESLDSGDKLSSDDAEYIKKFEFVLANKIEGQAREWWAFNDAYTINANAAMESTSIGLGQVMGFHFKKLGYRTALEMWNDAKKGIERQIWQMAKFVATDPRLINAIKAKNWHLVATYYNGAGYRELAARLGREPYNISMQKAYNKYKQ